MNPPEDFLFFPFLCGLVRAACWAGTFTPYFGRIDPMDNPTSPRDFGQGWTWYCSTRLAIDDRDPPICRHRDSWAGLIITPPLTHGRPELMRSISKAGYGVRSRGDRRMTVERYVQSFGLDSVDRLLRSNVSSASNMLLNDIDIKFYSGPNCVYSVHRRKPWS